MIKKEQGSNRSRKYYRYYQRIRNGAPYGSKTNQYIIVDDRNSITYEEGPSHDRTGATLWKRCTHTWRQMNTVPFRYKTWHVGDPAYTTYVCEHDFPDGYSALYNMAASVLPRVTPKSAAEMLHAAQYVMEGRLNQTLLPITDLVQLVRKVDGLGSIDALFTSILAPFRTKPKTFGDLVKKISGADLARKFGFQTLWRTITDTLQVGAVVDRHLRRLERIQNSQQRNFKVSVVDRVAGNTGVANIGSHPFGDPVIAADYRVEALAETSIHFRTSVRYDTSDALRTRLLWDAAGLSNAFSTAWDLLPLSFVIDWFVQVQRFASQLDSFYFHTVPLEKMTELQDVWITSTRRGQVILTGARAVPNGQIRGSLEEFPEEYTLGLGEFARYPIDNGAMSLWLPSLSVGGSGLTLAQNLTGLELLVQRTF